MSLRLHIKSRVDNMDNLEQELVNFLEEFCIRYREGSNPEQFGKWAVIEATRLYLMYELGQAKSKPKQYDT
jgi:hypothetical protein